MTINPLMTRERVVIPPRKAPTKAEKAQAWNAVNGLCWWCGKPVPPEGPDVEYDHDIPRAQTGDDSVERLAPLHVHCHAKKTNGKGGDNSRTAEAKRQEKLTQARKRSPRGIKAWRKFDGTIVRRP
jgi:5-methylcytosine-specific restriction endonuclease McrA